MMIKNKCGEVVIRKIDGYWCFEYLYVNEDKRGAGNATRLVESALRKCDKRPIYLFATSELGSDYKRLVDFYKKFGFVLEKRKNRFVPFNYNMILY